MDVMTSISHHVTWPPKLQYFCRLPSINIHRSIVWMVRNVIKGNLGADIMIV